MTPSMLSSMNAERTRNTGMPLLMNNPECVCGNGYTLWRGRCEEVLPDLEPVDALITDPPYGINMGKRMAANNACKFDGKYESKEWDRQRPSRAVFDLMLSRVKPGGVVIIWGGELFFRHAAAKHGMAGMG